MPNIASVFKAEIARIARKEIRSEVDGLKKAVNAYRSQIAALKRRAQDLERALRSARKAAPNATPIADDDGATPSLRFSAKGLASQRRRLGLSAESLGLLLGSVRPVGLQLGVRQGPSTRWPPESDRRAAGVEQGTGRRTARRSAGREVAALRILPKATWR